MHRGGGALWCGGGVVRKGGRSAVGEARQGALRWRCWPSGQMEAAERRVGGRRAHSFPLSPPPPPPYGKLSREMRVSGPAAPGDTWPIQAGVRVVQVWTSPARWSLLLQRIKRPEVHKYLGVSRRSLQIELFPCREMCSWSENTMGVPNIRLVPPRGWIEPATSRPWARKYAQWQWTQRQPQASGSYTSVFCMSPTPTHLQAIELSIAQVSRSCSLDLFLTLSQSPACQTGPRVVP
ncbi:hypothetical protein DFH27DRAFT_371169 [Peziza echinospora]|nr:hypothetical protein DFH27DRAFT_371169 [Peziza echinospora]